MNQRTIHQYLNFFADTPSKQLLYNSSLLELSNWSYPINKILNEYSFDEWLTNWNIEDIIKRTSIQRYMHKTEEIDFSQYTLYGKWTAHYLHPPTSLVFAHMAFYRKWSFFLQIREPINRLWSVQQHWHKYDG